MPITDANGELAAARRENEFLFATVRELGLRGDAPFVFLCECRDALCNDYVKLTLTEFDLRRRVTGFVLSWGHVPPAG